MSRPPAESVAQSSPMVLDALVMAHGGLTWEHEFSDTRFERLANVAVSNQPRVKIKLRFAQLDKRPTIHGEMQAEVELICQRCMGDMQYPLQESFDLMLIESEAELAVVPDSHEAWIANALHLNVLELVEEQLLLAMPLIPKHVDERDCLPIAAEAAVGESRPEKQSGTSLSDVDDRSDVRRPFGNLRDLLRKQ
jgi:uncharacterized protein